MSIELLHNHPIAQADEPCTTCEDKDRALEAMRTILDTIRRRFEIEVVLHPLGQGPQAIFPARSALPDIVAALALADKVKP